MHRRKPAFAGGSGATGQENQDRSWSFVIHSTFACRAVALGRRRVHSDFVILPMKCVYTPLIEDGSVRSGRGRWFATANPSLGGSVFSSSCGLLVAQPPATRLLQD